MRIGDRSLRLAAGVALLIAVSACGGQSAPATTAGPSSPPATATLSASAVASPSIPIATPTPTDTLAGRLIAVAEKVYPSCGADHCFTEGVNFTTCDGGFLSPPSCPATPRLSAQFDTICAAWVHDCPDMFGGGQDPVWATESLASDPSGTGGVAHVILGYPGLSDFKVDLVIVSSRGELLVDDLYPTGDDPATSDAYSGNWMPPHGQT